MKQILCAVLAMAILSIPCFPQRTTIEESLQFKPFEYIQRKKKADLISEAKAKAAIKENSPLANRATGFSLFFRLIGEHPTAERLESDKYRLSVIGIESVSEQNLIIEKAEEFVAMSNSNKYEAEQTIVKKHHTPGSKHHTEFTEEDLKAAKKLQDDKAKELRKIIKSLEQKISNESFAAIENYVLNVINPSTKFHLNPKGLTEVEKLKREGKKSIKPELECSGGIDECYPPNEDYYGGYTYTDTTSYAKGPRDTEVISHDGLIVDGTIFFNSESVYEVDPVSNSHGLNFSSEVRDFESGFSVSNLSTYVIWNEGVFSGQQTYYSLENFVSTENGGFGKRILYDVWCGGSFSYVQSQNYYFGTSNLAYYWSFRGSDGVDVFTHDRHSDNGFYCPTHCGDWISWRKRQATIVWKNRTPAPGELESTRLMIIVPWGSNTIMFKPEQQENSANDWCSHFGAGVGAKFMGVSLIPFDECFDKSVNFGWIWN